MRRKIAEPTVSVEDIKDHRAGRWVREQRTFAFISPVFGGGVRIDEHFKPTDAITPIRGSAIRGQLRFWWRAVNPRGCQTVCKLFDDEQRVFGAAASPSARDQTAHLGVRVVKQAGAPKNLEVFVAGDRFKIKPPLEALAYGAFPLRDADKDRLRHEMLREFAGDWTLEFAYPKDIENDVHAALWAWAHFGGLGGRTRRGFGAIEQRSPGLLSLDEGFSKWLGAGSPNHGSVPWPHLVAAADRRATARTVFDTGGAAQEHLLQHLQQLRQGNLGRKPSASRGARPGRSYWPEADAIRHKSDSTSPEHRTRTTHVDAAPRAAFGTPIIFHFKDQMKGDPRTHTLNPQIGGKTLGRWASPLVLRPHSNGHGKYEALAIILAHPPADGFVLEAEKPKTPIPIGSKLTVDQAKTLEPLKGDTSFVDPLQRYLHLLREGR